MTPGGYLRPGWEPMVRRDQDPDFEWNPNVPPEHRSDECWLNNRYQCLVKYVPNSNPDLPEIKKLSIHLRDRGPMRNWRHLQQIKNEVCGELSTGIEVFPPETALTDTANEYHLWVFPEGVDLGFGLGPEPLVTDDDAVEEFNAEPHQGHQEPWEDGLTTGRTEHSDGARESLREMGIGSRPPRVRRA